MLNLVQHLINQILNQVQMTNNYRIILWLRKKTTKRKNMLLW